MKYESNNPLRACDCPDSCSQESPGPANKKAVYVEVTNESP